MEVDKRNYGDWEDAIVSQIEEPVDMHLSRSQKKVAEEYKDWLTANLEPLLAFNLWACEDNFRQNTKSWCGEHGSNFWNRAAEKSRVKQNYHPLNLWSRLLTNSSLSEQDSICLDVGFFRRNLPQG